MNVPHDDQRLNAADVEKALLVSSDAIQAIGDDLDLSPRGARVVGRRRSPPLPETVVGAAEAAQVAELEMKLATYLHSAQPSLHLHHYNRQYVEFIREEKRYIYADFFRTSSGGPREVHDWSWSIVYALDRGTFQELNIDGLSD